MRLLEGDHYNRDAVHQSDYGEVVPDYMAALDGQHLFFLKSDQADFTARWDAKTLYANIAYLGNIDPAYEIYYVYQKRGRGAGQLDLRGPAARFRLDHQRDVRPRPLQGGVAGDARRRRRALAPAAEVRADRRDARQADPRPGQGDRPQALRADAQEHGRDRRRRPGRDVPDEHRLPLRSASELLVRRILRGIRDPDEAGAVGHRRDARDEGRLLRGARRSVPGGPADLGHQLKPDDKIISVAQEGRSRSRSSG